MEPHERIVTWSQAARQGESKENLKAGKSRVNNRAARNGEQGRAKPIRHYIDSLIKL